MNEFIQPEFNRIGLPHGTITAATTIDIDLVNRVLMQPHWQKEVDLTDF